MNVYQTRHTAAATDAIVEALLWLGDSSVSAAKSAGGIRQLCSGRYSATRARVDVEAGSREAGRNKSRVKVPGHVSGRDGRDGAAVSGVASRPNSCSE